MLCPQRIWKLGHEVEKAAGVEKIQQHQVQPSPTHWSRSWCCLNTICLDGEELLAPRHQAAAPALVTHSWITCASFALGMPQRSQWACRAPQPAGRAKVTGSFLHPPKPKLSTGAPSPIERPFLSAGLRRAAVIKPLNEQIRCLFTKSAPW